MNDQNLMQNILLLEKGVCDLYMHGAIESGTENVHQAFQTALNASL
ncbi:MAG: spore coat protein, partial [Bacillota bacterium]|nr:spore coat protein [Bacillota bacterium]